MPPSSLSRFCFSICRRGFKSARALYSDCDEPPDLCKTGCKQSPIEICSSNVKKIELPALTFSNHFADDTTFCMSQLEDTINLTPNATLMSLEGGPLNGMFILEKCHFHWGCDDKQGTEHPIDGEKFAMEAHLKYYNCTYGSFGKALNQPDGIAVVAVLMQAKPNAANCDFDTVIRCLPSMNPGKVLPVSKNVFKMFKGTLESQKYFTYEGSITAPPCCEEVTWLVFKDVMCIDCNQSAAFRKLCSEKGEPITNNGRATQSLNGRKVYDVKSQPKDDCK